jgi:hypothetical protein
MLRKMRIGAIGAIVATIAAILIDLQWGPLFGVYGWRVIAAGLMIGGFLLLAAFLEFIRPPNPYSRLYHLYDLRDLGPTGVVYSSDLSWLWNAVPLIAAIALIFLTDGLF